ncbi:hypothetical protein NUU61_008813 [Penicillium alfredii]|uniref:Zn(2)-C6 fungal-type domain-containing protein n=1 Tax=Penicillium alfredii TaxID=1506179 RepID=A0A9W9EM54_9EURO|nr:uncharacterized protein NUU61_008813 [Penicillium alfredii]KAJ5084234.1 hypothetical protein NUU61_008813 [Penicillium alfredii]
MTRMPPPDGPPAPPGAHGAYEPSWRPPFPPSFDGHGPDSRRSSTTSQTPLPPQGYPAMHRELPQLPLDGPYGRPNSLPGSVQSPPAPEANPHPGFRPSIGDISPHSGPEYRVRMGFQHSESEPVPTSGPSQYLTPTPPIATTPGPYDPSYYQNQSYAARQRKAARATQACDQCRSRKAKCDEGRPACSHCKENSLICVYKEVPPHKQEKTTQLVLDRIMQMEDRMDDRMSQLQTVQVEHGTILSSLMSDKYRMIKDRPIAPVPTRDPLLKAEVAGMMKDTEMQDEHSSFYSQKLEPMETTLEEQQSEGELSIPVEHTTAAHKLLMWPSIKKLLYPHEYDEDYVMRLEEERGLISVYGQGEISYTADDSELPPFPRLRDGSKWEDDGATRNQQSSEFFPDANSDIDRVGRFMADADTSRRYYQSYLENMHKLHPFLDQNELNEKVENFIRFYCPPSSTSAPGSSSSRDSQTGTKRKRSNENLRGARSDSQSTDGSSNPSRPRVGRNIDNAIILLIFAIGAICETKSPLPGPILDHKPDFRKEHIPGPMPPIKHTHNPSDVLSPTDSGTGFPTTASLYAIADNTGESFALTAADYKRNLSRRDVTTSQDRFGRTKNHQVIPGLTLYGYATVILGHLQGGIELEHVQAGLLAGLYAGQLAHPFQSHGWIAQASRACHVLVRAKRYERLEDGPTLDLYNFAYWTCLQLESDLLAELDLPASGISRSEGRMGLPKGKYTICLPDDLSAPSTMMMLFYSAQIHLRKVLNRVHTDLYKVEKQGQTRWSSNVQETLSMNLDLWRTSLPDNMKWKDNDPPTDDINAARMRAKYYGARYIIHRPLLYHALHYGQTGARIGSVAQNTVDSPTGSMTTQTQHLSPSMANATQRASAMTRISSDLGTAAPSLTNGWAPPTVNLRELPQKLRRACKVCIDSAILSTEAFDGIPDRLVVTNIFGTAHAQFGNMLVLSATYMSSLTELVDKNTLERLLKRTIRFLLRSENISPTLRADARILTEIYQKIFGHLPQIN